MKRTIALVLIMIMSLITSVGAVNAETRLQTTAIATEIKAVGMPLQELLDLLTRSSGIELVAVPKCRT